MCVWGAAQWGTGHPSPPFLPTRGSSQDWGAWQQQAPDPGAAPRKASGWGQPAAIPVPGRCQRPCQGPRFKEQTGALQPLRSLPCNPLRQPGSRLQWRCLAEAPVTLAEPVPRPGTAHHGHAPHTGTLGCICRPWHGGRRGRDGGITAHPNQAALLIMSGPEREDSWEYLVRGHGRPPGWAGARVSQAPPLRGRQRAAH